MKVEDKLWSPRSSQHGTVEQLAKGLGWFSIGLGLAELIAPKSVARLIGVKGKSGARTLLRLYGLREIAAGVGILSSSKPSEWLWGRIAGDLLDLASLASAMGSGNANRARLTAATAAVVGVTALDAYCAQQLGQGSPQDGRIHEIKTITINRSPEEVYDFWHNFENFPTFMDHLESVRVTGERQSHWKAKAPAGTSVEWDAEITIDQSNSLIAWRSLPGSEVDNAGAVRFERATGGRGTVVRVELEYTPPAGTAGFYIAKLFGREPGQEIESALRRLKQILETGDITRSDASIHAGMHEAQPPSERRPDDTQSTPRHYGGHLPGHAGLH